MHQGYLGFRPEIPAIGKGVEYKKKIIHDLGLNWRTAPSTCKKGLTPPHPPDILPNKWHPVIGGLRGQKSKNAVAHNDDFTRGWASDITHQGMLCYNICPHVR